MTTTEQEPVTVAEGLECGIWWVITGGYTTGFGEFDMWLAAEWAGAITGPVPACVERLREMCRERAESNLWRALDADPTHGNKA